MAQHRGFGRSGDSGDGSSGGSGRGSRKIKWLAGVIVVVIALYTGVWFFLASKIDSTAERVIAQAGEQGATIECENRDVRGFPFRLGLFCEDTGVVAPGQRGEAIRLDAGGFRSAAQVYRPNRIISEIDGPLSLSTPEGLEAEGNWTLARASTSFGTEQLNLGTFEMTDATIRATPPGGEAVPFKVARVFGAIQPKDGDLDASITLTNLDVDPIAGRDAPPIDLFVDATLSGAADVLAFQSQPIESLRGRTVVLRRLDLDVEGGGETVVTGTVAFDAQGLANGTIDLEMTDLSATIGAVATLFPEMEAQLTTVSQLLEGGTMGGILAAASGGEVTAPANPKLRKVSVTIENGRAKVGLFPIATIPPVN